ncbi:YbaB/EbfC family nucleoid-associated protein [Mycobacterium simiae]|uniref:YbaB/EbfC family nucleoid-associated protein n=1 Tax=Mycobacterium simiae TaxID=1784 RepID=UPI00262CA5FB|nr:YbaB/EbfC family nucleoid-associated protein [Mycobacterium simiae]
MTVYEYASYQADAELTNSVIARIERVQSLLTKMTDELSEIAVDFEGGDGDIVLTVNYEGQLTSLTLAEGSTSRYTHEGFQDLYNDTLHAAVAAATAEAAALTGAEDEEALNAALAALADPDSHIWTSDAP